jgi:GNAT superfamily N-acetyltransferase
MSLEIRQEVVTPQALAEHGRTSIAFTVDRVLAVELAEGAPGGVAVTLTETPVAEPYVKDYDAVSGEGPTRWADTFDLSNWGMIGAYRDGARVGGAVLAFQTPYMYMLAGRRDVAMLWDLRVAPEHRGSGAGSALFLAAEVWAAERGAGWLKIETQNVNAPACRFYRKMGCTLGGFDRFAYPGLPHETQLLWWKPLLLRAGGEGGAGAGEDHGGDRGQCDGRGALA